MVFIKTIKKEPDKEFIELVHYQPQELSENEINTGYLIENYIEPQPQIGMIPVAYYRPSTGEIFFEFIPRPLTDKEKIAQFETTTQEQLNTINLAIAELSMLMAGGM